MKRPKPAAPVKSGSDDLVRRLALCAENRGMHAAHVVEFPHRLREAGIDPIKVTPSIVHQAQMFQRAMIDAVMERCRALNDSIVQRTETQRKEQHVSYRCDACGGTVPAGKPMIKFPLLKPPSGNQGSQLETEVPVCQKCYDRLKYDKAPRALLAEIRAEAVAAKSAGPKPPPVPPPPVVAPKPKAVSL